MKKTISLAMAAALAISGAVTTVPVFADDVTNITIWSPTDREAIEAWWKDKIAEWNKDHPEIQVSREAIDRSDSYAYDNKIATAVTSNDLPDIFYVDGPQVSYYAANGITVPLDDYFTDEDKADFVNSSMTQNTYDGKLYAVGATESSVAFYYNKDYLDQVGVDVPESWDDLVDACAKLKEAGIQPFNYSDKDNYHFEHLMSALALKAYGTSIADDLASDKEAYNGEKMVAIYQKMKDMIDAGYWGDGILSTDFNTERNMFEAGKAAFTVDGTWNCGNFQNDSDTTLFDAQKIGVTRIPYIDEANKTVEMGGGSDTYYITTLNKSDEEIAATVKFIKYLTSVDSINEMCKSSPTTYAEKVTIDTGNYLLDDVNAIMAENTESKLEIPTYDSNTAAMDTIRNSLQALATGASAQEVGDDIVDKMSAYE